MSQSNSILRGTRGIRGTRGTRGFTLVEILIVVIILGILAAIVIPQFSNATSQARAGNVQTQLQTVRQQLAVYSLNHNGVYPDLVGQGWLQMTEYTDASGNASATQDATHVYGPYLPSAPINPLVTSTTTNSVVGLTSSGACGWYYNQGGGQFAASGSTAGTWFNDADGTDNNAVGNGKPW